jgi:DNA-binding NtrC family response regulator
MEPGDVPTILFIDDDENIRRVFGDVLRRAGYDVTEARHSLEALELDDRRLSHIDLIVTDVMMPGIDGLQLLQRLRARYPGVPVLVISGYPEFAMPVDTVRDAPTAFLGKPFTGLELVRAVRQLLGNY